jgi:hypothetical protein
MDAFLKAVKWFFFIACIIVGIAAMSGVEEHGVKPLMLGVVSMGLAYIMSGPWRSLSKVPMLCSILVVLLMAFLARYMPWLSYFNWHGIAGLNYFLAWTGLVFFAGIPIMTLIFQRYND